MTEMPENRNLIRIYPQLKDKRICVMEAPDLYLNIVDFLLFQGAKPGYAGSEDWYAVDHGTITLRELLNRGQYDGLIMHANLKDVWIHSILDIHHNGIPFVLVRGQSSTDFEPVLFAAFQKMGIPVVSKLSDNPYMYKDLIRELAGQFASSDSAQRAIEGGRAPIT